MAKITQFEDIEGWKEARKMTAAVYAVTQSGQFARDFSLKDQIRRAAASVMSNIAEGFDRGGHKEFIQFLYIAKGSAAEVQAQLYIALDAGYVSLEDFEKLYNQARLTGKLIGGFIRYLSNVEHKGIKYKS